MDNFDFVAGFLLCVFSSFILLGFIADKTDRTNTEQSKQYIIWYYHNIFLCVLRHGKTLLNKYQRGRRMGDYDEVIDEDWKHEVRYFVQHMIIPSIGDAIETSLSQSFIVPEEQFVKGIFPEEEFLIKKFKFSDYISDLKKGKEETVFVYCCKKPSLLNYDVSSTIGLSERSLNILYKQVEILCKFLFGSEIYNIPLSVDNPIDYEMMVAALLKDLGFKVRTTKASGDQGADVLAGKNGISFAIQCKMYSKPVGNKAVQEANAGRDFYKCDYGVVVSNAGFTKSAKQAANACKIILLNERQLEKLLKYVPEGHIIEKITTEKKKAKK